RYDHQQNRHLLNQRNEPKAPVTPAETVPSGNPQPAPEPAAAPNPAPKPFYTPPSGFSYLDFTVEPVEIPSEPPPERPQTMTAAS
ncbi:MAG: hypothetical protein ABI693_22145, partial [Bryobacteraceae bacterium]